jgi:hypothetical protein
MVCAFSTLRDVAGGVASTAGRAVHTAAQVAAPALTAGGDPFAQVEHSMRGTLGGNDPAALRDAAVSGVRAAVTGDGRQADDARTRAAEALAKAQNIPVEEARMQVQQYMGIARTSTLASGRRSGRQSRYLPRRPNRGCCAAVGRGRRLVRWTAWCRRSHDHGPCAGSTLGGVSGGGQARASDDRDVAAVPTLDDIVGRHDGATGCLLRVCRVHAVLVPGRSPVG